MKTQSLALVLLTLALGVVGCDHLRANDASAEQTTKSEKPTAPVSMVPPSDRYGQTTGEAH